MAEFSRDYDVVVAGAGVAGVAAAVAAARDGMKTALVEKTALFGGLATSGLVNIYLPLCDGHGRQVTFGIAEELLHLSMRYGPGDVPDDWQRPDSGSRYKVTFSPAAFALALDEMLVAAGVDPWLDTLVCLPIVEGDRLVGLEVENKSGRGRLGAGCVIDATGDADVAYRAGAPCAEADNWLNLWAVQASLSAAQQAVSAGHGTALLDTPWCGADAWGRGHPAGHRRYRGTNGRDVSQFLLACRRLLLEHYQDRQRQGSPTGRSDVFPVALPSIAQFRTTRRIIGDSTLGDGDAGRRFDDSIGVVATWFKFGEVWEVPFSTLVPRSVRGLLVAGRCISAERSAWEVTRVIPAAAMTGQVAGVAAGLAVRHQTTPDRLDAAAVQDRLVQASFVLHVGDPSARP